GNDMLKVEMTDNYGGFKVSGYYDDLDFLYDSINHFIVNNPISDKEDMMRIHIYAFLYDVRHAYQGDRCIGLITNELSDYKRDKLGINGKKN
ncbi:MAG: hypothetical protein K2G03_02105, partial [Bacilli bacterium]|nr:hypothetical protein [Bacilli bacterium]